MSVQFPYGLRDGKIYHVSEVENGIECGCICPHCKAQLIAKNNGRVVEHHFQHYNSEECEHGYETALHFLAKQIILEERRISVPDDKCIIEPINTIYKEAFQWYRKEITIVKEQVLQVDSVGLEKMVNNVIPDIIIGIGEEKIFIEIIVTNPLSEEKIQKVMQLNSSLLSINLSGLSRDISKDELRAIVIDSIDYKSWVYIKEKENIKTKEINLLNIECENSEKDYLDHYTDIEDNSVLQCPRNKNNPVNVDSSCGTCPDYKGIRKFGESNKVVCLYNYNNRN